MLNPALVFLHYSKLDLNTFEVPESSRHEDQNTSLKVVSTVGSSHIQMNGKTEDENATTKYVCNIDEENDDDEDDDEGMQLF